MPLNEAGSLHNALTPRDVSAAVTGHFLDGGQTQGAIVFWHAVIHADFVSMDGSSNWLLGLQLCGTYVLISLM